VVIRKLYFFFIKNKHFQKTMGTSKFLLERDEDSGALAIWA
jgi:hypothetical protein